MKLTHTIVTLSREQMNSLNELVDKHIADLNEARKFGNGDEAYAEDIDLFSSIKDALNKSIADISYDVDKCALAEMIHTEKEGTIAYQFADSLIRFNRTEEGDIECEDEEAEAFIRGAQEILIVNTEIARTMQFYEIANFANEDDKFIMFDESLCVLITEDIQAVINKQ